MAPLAVSLVLFSTLLHASWNLLAKRDSAAPNLFPRVLLAVAVPGVLIGLLGEWRGTALLPEVWPFLLIAGAFQAAYFLGLTMGYRTGDLGLVYPLVRALPVLLVSAFDVLRGQVPGAAGWLGLALVLGGCVLVAGPARAVHADATGPRWHGAAIGWAAIAALGTVGYTVADKLAADAVAAAGRGGGVTAFRYGIWEFTITTAYFLPLLALWERLPRRSPSRLALRAARRPAEDAAPPSPFASGSGRWPVTVLIAALMVVTYTLVLWAYQMSWLTGYVVALRQFSIVLGVVGGILLLGESARALRIGGAVVIVAGVAAITLAGSGSA